MPNHIKKNFMTLGIVKNSHNAQTAHIYNYSVHVYQLDFIVFHLWINQIQFTANKSPQSSIPDKQQMAMQTLVNQIHRLYITDTVNDRITIKSSYKY